MANKECILNEISYKLFLNYQTGEREGKMHFCRYIYLN